MSNFKSFLQESKQKFYHGSKTKISEFSFKHISADGTRQLVGPGVYFTSSIEDAKVYGPYIHEVEIDITKSKLVPMKKAISRGLVEDLIKAAPELEDALTNWDEYPDRALRKATDAIYRRCAPNEYFDMVTTVWGDFYDGENEAWIDEMMKLGWQGAMFDRAKGVKHFIAYDLSKVKIIGVLEE